jgi:hypothetical protein
MNNRENATLIWLGIVLAAVLANREMRGSLWEVVKAVVHPKIVGPLLLFAGWTVGLVALAVEVGLWKSDVLSDTITWFLTAGLAFFFSIKKVTEAGFVRTTARRAVAVTVFVETFANLEVFPLGVELVLLPILVLLAGMLVVSEGKEELAPARRLVNLLLTSVGVCVLMYVLVRLATDFDGGHTFRALALPVWLTIGSLPFVYAFGLVAEYEKAFLRIDLRTDDPIKRRRAKRALAQAAHVRAAELGGFAIHWISNLTDAESDAEARRIARRWRKTWRVERREHHMADARAHLELWLTQTDPTLQEMWAESFQRSWERLDREQRATLKAEALESVPRSALAADLHALPD